VTDKEHVDIIAIDGLAGSGKSTTARLVARKIGFTYLDTGAMYRAFALKAHQHGVKPEDATRLNELIRETDIRLLTKNERLRVLLDGEDVTREIRTENISRLVATVAAQPSVRLWMVSLQRKIACCGGIVAEGRDIGTVVFPNARLKIYLKASLETRAKRRLGDFQKQNEKTELQRIVREIDRRDKFDSNRKNSPLIKAADAIEIDTTNLSIEEQVNLIVEHWQKRKMQK